MKYLPLLALMVSFGVAARATTVVPTTDLPTQSSPGVGQLNDYPTDARAEYVFACMATNGGTRDALERCSCSIDEIAAALPYETYQKADTVLRMRLGAGGYLGAMVRTKGANEVVRDLKEAQAEADVRCF